MSGPLFLHLRFHGFALTIRRIPAVTFVPGLAGEPRNGEPEPYAFTADGIAVNPLRLDSLRVLTETDLLRRLRHSRGAVIPAGRVRRIDVAAIGAWNVQAARGHTDGLRVVDQRADRDLDPAAFPRADRGLRNTEDIGDIGLRHTGGLARRGEIELGHRSSSASAQHSAIQPPVSSSRVIRAPTANGSPHPAH